MVWPFDVLMVENVENVENVEAEAEVEDDKKSFVRLTAGDDNMLQLFSEV